MGKYNSAISTVQTYMDLYGKSHEKCMGKLWYKNNIVFHTKTFIIINSKIQFNKRIPA